MIVEAEIVTSKNGTWICYAPGFEAILRFNPWPPKELRAGTKKRFLASGKFYNMHTRIILDFIRFVSDNEIKKLLSTKSMRA